MSWFKWFRRLKPAPPSAESHSFVEAPHNFSPRAQRALALARAEADRLNHNFVGTEHLLLGLVALGQGVAVKVLQKLGLDLETVRMEVEKEVGTGPDQKMIGNIPYTPRVRKVLALAAKEARALNHTYVGTEHILLGLLRAGAGVAARVLKNLNVNIEQTRLEILKELDPNFEVPSETTGSSESHPNPPPPKPPTEVVDVQKRYDVYCVERDQEVVAYRNARFKGTKSLFRRHQYDSLSDFLELEQADGRTIFIARRSVIKFCEHGATSGPEGVPGEKP